MAGYVDNDDFLASNDDNGMDDDNLSDDFVSSNSNSSGVLVDISSYSDVVVDISSSNVDTSNVGYNEARQNRNFPQVGCKNH